MESSPSWLASRRELSKMIKQGRSFSGHERNCCFLNTGKERFATVSAVSGLDFPDDARCVAVVDWDHDGDLDVWLSNRNAPRLRFMRNDSVRGNHFVSFRLVGNGTTTNRDAIGARVEVVVKAKESGTRRVVKTIHAGQGFLSQSSKRVHFGLADAERIEKVIVRWPGRNAQVEEFTDLQVDQRYTLEQSTGRPLLDTSSDRTLALNASSSSLPPASRVARIPLVTPLYMPPLSFRALDGTESTLKLGSGRHLLVNLWASWCGPCVQELSEIAHRSDELRSAGIDVVAMSVDGFGEEDAAMRQHITDAKAALDSIGFPFAAGVADRGFFDVLQNYHNHVVSMWRPLPVPTSFLIDGESRLAVIYKGPIAVDEVLADTRRLDARPSDPIASHSEFADVPTTSYRERIERAARIPGTAIDNPLLVASRRGAETRTRYRVAVEWNAADRLSEAAAVLHDLLQFNPEFAEAHGQLAIIYLRQRDLGQAAKHCRLALKLDSENAGLQNTMGNILSEQRKPKQAAAHYQRAIQIDPTDVKAQNNLGTVYASQGDLAAAARHFRRAIELDPDSAESHNNLGSVFAFNGDLAQASKHYQQAIRSDPTYAEAYNNLGSMFARRGDLKGAIQQYERALEINPSYREARDNLSRAQSSLKNQ